MQIKCFNTTKYRQYPGDCEYSYRSKIKALEGILDALNSLQILALIFAKLAALCCQKIRQVFRGFERLYDREN